MLPYYRARLRTFIQILIPFFVTLLVARIIFVFLYFPEDNIPTFLQILTACIYGLRFDIASVFLTTATLGLIYLLPIFYSWFYKIISILFWLSFIAFQTIIVSDLVYYASAGKKIGIEIQTLGTSTWEVFYFSFVAYSWAWAINISILLLWRKYFKKEILPWLDSPKLGKIQLSIWPLMITLYLAIIVLGVRGGLQKRPLKPVMAYQNENVFLANIALNGVYQIITSLYKKNYLPIHQQSIKVQHKTARRLCLDENETLINSNYPFYRKRIITKSQAKTNKNVVILIIESLGTYNLTIGGQIENATPFLDSLAQNGLFYSRHYSLGTRTIPVLPAIVSSMPSFYGQVYTTASYQNNKQIGLASIFKKLGYDTMFLYAAGKDSMGFSSYAPIAGFERVITGGDFENNDENSDGIWGRYDHLTLNRLKSEMDQANNANKHFFYVMETLHPHDPFKLPSSYAQLYPEFKDKPFLKALRYVDDSLKKFFDKIKKQSYYKDTLFVIVGDHGYTQKEGLNKFNTPLIFYSPSSIRPNKSNKIISQVDIMPTIIDMLDINLPYTAIGKSALKKNNWAILDFDNYTGWYKDEFLLLSSEEKTLGLYNPTQDPLLKHNLLNNKLYSKTLANTEAEWSAFSSAIANSLLNSKLMPQ